MTDSKRQTSAQQQTERGVIGWLLIKIMQAVLFLLITLFFSIIIEWVGMAFQYWDESGSLHSETMLKQELMYLNDDFKRSALVEKPIRFAQRFADTFYDYTFEKTGVKAALHWLATPVSETHHEFRYQLHHYYLYFFEYLQALITVTQIFAVRLAVLTLALPAFLLLSLTGLIDGLVQRDVRRWSAGRESSFVYHWAKRFLAPSLILPWVIYLAMPFSVHPNLIVLPFAFIFAVSVTVMASTFKKYL